MSENKTINLTINGKPVSCAITPSNSLLINLLRHEMKQTGTKEACGVGVCGLCTVWKDGKTISSCTFPTICAEGSEIYTAEGLQMMQEGENTSPLAPNLRLWDIVQQAFLECEGMQCGICTPGQIMSAVALLTENPKPNKEAILDYMAGNLCRCTGYQSILAAIELAAERWENTNATV